MELELFGRLIQRVLRRSDIYLLLGWHDMFTLRAPSACRLILRSSRRATMAASVCQDGLKITLYGIEHLTPILRCVCCSLGGMDILIVYLNGEREVLPGEFTGVHCHGASQCRKSWSRPGSNRASRLGCCDFSPRESARICFRSRMLLLS